jgi:hypothetical protein
MTGLVLTLVQAALAALGPVRSEAGQIIFLGGSHDP